MTLQAPAPRPADQDDQREPAQPGGGPPVHRADLRGGRAAAAGSQHAGRLPQLDGLRGLAVLLVLAFHVSRQAFPGGFVGVDVFFVLSGYLITDILLRRVGPDGAGIGGFYARRLRRLLPALLLVSTVMTLAIVLLDPAGESPDQAGRTLWGVAAALGYVSNIVLVNAGPDALGFMGHAWSLSVEEHFYLVWPLVLLCCARRKLSRRRMAGVVAGLFALGAVLPLGLLAAGSGTDRLYFGSDTRAYSLLAGGLLAVVMSDQGMRGPLSRLLGTPSAVIGLVVVIVATLALDRDGGLYYGGGGLLMTVSTAVLIGSLVSHPSGPVSRLLSRRPLAQLGAWSYSLYLWHYPLILLAYSARGSADEQQRTLVRAAAASLAVPLAWATWRWVERPVQERGWRGALPRRTASAGGPR